MASIQNEIRTNSERDTHLQKLRPSRDKTGNHLKNTRLKKEIGMNLVINFRRRSYVHVHPQNGVLSLPPILPLFGFGNGEMLPVFVTSSCMETVPRFSTVLLVFGFGTDDFGSGFVRRKGEGSLELSPSDSMFRSDARVRLKGFCMWTPGLLSGGVVLFLFHSFLCDFSVGFQRGCLYGVLHFLG